MSDFNELGDPGGVNTVDQGPPPLVPGEPQQALGVPERFAVTMALPTGTAEKIVTYYAGADGVCVVCNTGPPLNLHGHGTHWPHDKAGCGFATTGCNCYNPTHPEHCWECNP